jgi:pimeloyl-ACP methyl ester carboxylesterase
MDDLFRSLAFIWRMNYGPTPAVEISTTELGPDRIQADIYRTPGSKSRGVILSVHGMTLLGYRDPRIVRLCSMLSLSGHTIVSANYEEIADLRVDLASMDRLVDTIRAVTADPDLRPPSGRIGVLAHSFSAGLALAAIARPEAAERVSVFCSIGGAYEFDVAVESVMGRQDENHYPRHLVLLNFLHHSIGRRPGVQRALRAGLEDNGYQREEPHLPRILASLDSEDRELFLRLQDDPQFRLYHLERFRSMLGPINRAMGGCLEVRLPVILIHGLNDTVVPASQAREMYSRLRQCGVVVRLDISPLLDHNRPQLGLRLMAPAVSMLRTFSMFFRLTAEHGRPRPYLGTQLS